MTRKKCDFFGQIATFIKVVCFHNFLKMFKILGIFPTVHGNEFAVNGRFNSKNCKNVYFFSFLKNPSGGVPAPDLTEGVKRLPRAYLRSYQ